MEQGSLGVVLPVQEVEHVLFGGLVILLHVIGQVAGGRNQVAAQGHHQERPLRSAFQRGGQGTVLSSGLALTLQTAIPYSGGSFWTEITFRVETKTQLVAESGGSSLESQHFGRPRQEDCLRPGV